MNKQTIQMPQLSFYWQMKEADKNIQQENANKLMMAAIAGGMPANVAKMSVEEVFSAGYSAGSDFEAYHSSEN